MPEWTFVIDDHAANALTPLLASTAITLTFTRNRTPELAFSCSVEADEAASIVAALPNGLPRIRAYRDGTLRFYGRWVPMQEQAEASDQGVTEQAAVTFRGPGMSLDSRWTAASVTFTSTDAGQIAWSLINTANGESPTGIAQGTIAATVNRDRTYEHKNVGEAIRELTEVTSGFDFEIAPTLASGIAVLGLFNAYASQGTDKSATVTFDFGADTTGTLRAVGRTWMLPVNKARVLGADGLTAEASDAASITKHGLWMTLEQALDVNQQATLDAKASALLRPDPVEIVQFAPEPSIAPQPWVDYWLGDTVAVRSRFGSLDFERDARVNGITITVDDNGNEVSHELTFEAAV